MTINYDYINEDRIRDAGNVDDLDKLVNALAKEYGVTFDTGDAYHESAAKLENVAKLLYAADDRWLELEDK